MSEGVDNTANRRPRKAASGDAYGRAQGRARAKSPTVSVAAMSAKVADGRRVYRDAAELTLRRLPRQSRGRATFDSILEATGHLLETLGADGITTNVIAEAAGVNIATLYQYFPNKHAILLALFEQQADARMINLATMIDGLGDNSDWRQQIARASVSLAENRRAQRGATALRQLMRSSIEFSGFDLRTIEPSALLFADEIMKRGTVAREKADVAGRCVMEMITALFDFWLPLPPEESDLFLDEIKVAVIGYLAPYLDSSTPP